MSKYQNKLYNIEYEDEACFDHIVNEVNRELDIIKYTGNFEFDKRLSVGTLTVYLESKIVSNTWYRNERGSDEKKIPFWPKDIMKRMPRIIKIGTGGGNFAGDYRVYIQHKDPDSWPDLDYVPKIPEPPKPWWRSIWPW